MVETTFDSVTSALPEGYSSRPPTLDDAAGVASLIAACQAADGGKPESSEEEVRSDWQTLDLNEEALVVIDDRSEIVGSVDLLNRNYLQVFVYGYVHPDHRGRGIGSFLVEWGEDWARSNLDKALPGARVEVRFYVNAANGSARPLLEGKGYKAVRGVHVMAVAFDGPPAEPDWPQGVTVRNIVVGQDEPIAYETIEDSFRDHWGRTPNTLDSMTKFIAKDTFATDLSYLAESNGQVAGAVLCEVVEGTGWVSTLGVRRAWRKKGLGLALLRQSFGEGYRRGIKRFKLSVDSESPTNAPGLYRRAGMEVESNFIVYQKEIRPGKDMTTLGKGEEA